MAEDKIPYLSGCVLYLLLRKAALPDASPRQHKEGVKDDHKNPIFMSDLVYTFTGVQTVGSSTDTSNYREGKKEGTINVPFNDSAYISAFDDAVKNRYAEPLERVCQFVTWHMNPEMRGWFVKACLDVIENDDDIDDTDVFYIRSDGSATSKSELRDESAFELQPFLLGILHYILVQRAGKNHLGVPTLDANSRKVYKKERVYNGQLGNSITRNIMVVLYEKKEVTKVVVPAKSPVESKPLLVSNGSINQTDDEIISEAINRTGEILASALSEIKTPKIGTEVMAGSLATIAAVAKSIAPDGKQKEALEQGVSTIASSFEAQKHALAEEIQKKNRWEGNGSSSHTPDTDEDTTEGKNQGDKKTTIIQQQTNVIQNGDNNVNVTNNGTINFNF